MYVLENAAEFNAACVARDRTISIKCDVTVNGTTTTLTGAGQSGSLVSFEWSNIVCSDDGMELGTTCMDEFKMEYRYTNTYIPLDSVIKPYIGVETDEDEITWVPCGVFYVTNVETEDDGVTYLVTAYDGFVNAMEDFDPVTIGVTFPINAWDLLEAIADYLDVDIDYTVETQKLLSSDAYLLTVNSEQFTVA